MLTTKTRFLLPTPLTASEGAWFIAVALIGQADLDKPQLSYELPLDDIFVQPEDISYDLLREATGRARSFIVRLGGTTDYSAYDSICLFLGMGYGGNPSHISVDLNQGALPYLRQLQDGIKQLLQQNKLTQAGLTIRMKALSPSATFDMKKDPKYKATPLWSFTRREGSNM